MLVYRNTIYYYTLLSYPATLLNLFIGFNHFFRGYLRFFYIQYHHLQIETVLLTPFESGCLLFLFLVRTTNTMFNGVQEQTFLYCS